MTSISSQGQEARQNPERPLLVHATLVSAHEQDEIAMGEVFAFMREYATRMIAIASLCAALAFGCSYFVHRIYRAEATVLPVTQRDTMSALGGLASRLGGVAGLLGMDITGGDGTATSLAQLQSRQLLMLFISEKNLLPVLFPERWDGSKQQWKVAASRIPTLQDGFLRFSKKIFSVREDRKNGLVVVAVEWRNARTAALWANEIIARTNAFIAKQASDEAERNLGFLNQELTRTNEIGLRQAIYALMETEIKKQMLARTQPDYAFRVLDPAVPPLPHRYVRPQRVLFALGGFMLGAMVSGFYFAIRRSRSADLQSTESLNQNSQSHDTGRS